MFSTSCRLNIFFCEFLNLEESDRGCGDSIGDDGSSEDWEDSDESDTTGIIFFLVVFFPLSFSSVILPLFILVLVPIAWNIVKEMVHRSFTAYLGIAWQTGQGPLCLILLLLVKRCPCATLCIVWCPGIQGGGLRGSRCDAGHGYCVIMDRSNMETWDR